MDITLTYARPAEGPGSGPAMVGWLRDIEKGGVLCDPPERLKGPESGSTHAKSAARCPAVIQMESRFFVVKCPFDLHIGFTRGKDGRPQLVNRLGTRSPVRPAKIGDLLVLVSEPEWRVAGGPPPGAAARQPARPPPYAASPLCALPARVASRDDLRRAVSAQPLAAPDHVGLGMARARARHRAEPG